jgi:hypothetical protein
VVDEDVFGDDLDDRDCVCWVRELRRRCWVLMWMWKKAATLEEATTLCSQPGAKSGASGIADGAVR